MRPLLIGLFVCAWAGSASAMSAKDLIRSCEKVLSARLVDNRISLEKHAEPCWFYMMAVQDLASIREFGMCLPEEVRLARIVRVFVDNAKRYPQLGHHSAIDLAIASLREAFPCR
jgi:Rap1a immunity proteins